MVVSKFDEQYQTILNNGIKYLLKTYDDVSFTPENVLIIDKNITFETPVSLPRDYTRFVIFYVYSKTNSTRTKKNLNVMLLDNETETVSYFCANNLKWCNINSIVVERYIKKMFGPNYRLNYIPARFTSPIKDKDYEFDLFKTEFKSLMWNLFWISLKLKNPKFTDDVLEEYYLINVKKRKDLKSLLIDFFEKINK